MQRPDIPIEAAPAGLSKAQTALPPALKAAVWLTTAVFGGSVLMIAILAGHLFWAAGHRDRAAARWMQALDLSMPALWPSGTPVRSPESVTGAVDLRMIPMDADLDRQGGVLGAMRGCGAKGSAP